jgi:hypothetical protein
LRKLKSDADRAEQDAGWAANALADAEAALGLDVFKQPEAAE